jgi:hypothetical protein
LTRGDEIGHRSSSVSAEGKDPNKKHRHDVGAVDHGPVQMESTTRTIQVMLGAAIALSAALVVYAFLGAGFGVWVW